MSQGDLDAGAVLPSRGRARCRAQLPAAARRRAGPVFLWRADLVSRVETLRRDTSHPLRLWAAKIHSEP